LGAALCFDRLRKTVDHSGVVEDEVYASMWRRLLPYVRQLVAGRHEEGVPFRVHSWPSGAELSPRAVRDLLSDVDRVVCVDAQSSAQGLAAPALARLAAIRHALDTPALLIDPQDLDSLRMLGSATTAFLWPSLDSDTDRSHFESPPQGPPRRPWLVEVRDGPVLERE